MLKEILIKKQTKHYKSLLKMQYLNLHSQYYDTS